MRWNHASAAAVTFVAAALAFAAGRWSALPAKDACPELDGVDPALIALDMPALERRFVAGAVLPPAAAEKQLASLRAQGDAAPPERRACVRRAAIARATESQEHSRRGTPSLWGLDHPSAELREAFLAQPLKAGWSREERLDVLDQLEQGSIARLAGQAPVELEYWRRRWYGLALVCEGTDEALAKLGAARPPDCPRYAPRKPAP